MYAFVYVNVILTLSLCKSLLLGRVRNPHSQLAHFYGSSSCGVIAHRGSIMPQFCTQCNVKYFEETMGIAYPDSLTPTKNIQNVPIEQVLEYKRPMEKYLGGRTM